jgi:hypothetical protein
LFCVAITGQILSVVLAKTYVWNTEKEAERLGKKQRKKHKKKQKETEKERERKKDGCNYQVSVRVRQGNPIPFILLSNNSSQVLNVVYVSFRNNISGAFGT